MRDRNTTARKFLQELSAVNECVPIIVEGFHDVHALRTLGIRGAIVKVHSGRSIQQFCEDYSSSYNEAVILTDWDSRGNQLFTLLTRFLEADWERYNHFRETLRDLAGGSFQEVERMTAWCHLALTNP